MIVYTQPPIVHVYTNKRDTIEHTINIPKNIPSIKLTNNVYSNQKDNITNKTSYYEILKSEYRKQKLKYDLNKIFEEYSEHEEREIHKQTNLKLLHILYVDSLAIVFIIWFFYYR